MIISSSEITEDIAEQIERFILMRAEVNGNCHYDPPTETDFQAEESELRETFANANSICLTCFGTDEMHYLNCNVWDSLKVVK